jgi:hypothetical protein
MMAITPYKEVDYLDLMQENITEAFKDKVVFNKYLQLFSTEANALNDTFRDLMQKRSIDTAVGEQLDIIGRIVGQPRQIVNAMAFPYFGFDGADMAQSYGDLTNSRFGGYYYDLRQPLTGNVKLNDDQYRLFIKAKIKKNVTRSTPEDVISFIRFVFDVDSVRITNDSGASVTIVLVGQGISSFTLTVLQQMTEEPYVSYFLPKTLGVKYNFVISEGDGYFSFDGVVGGAGYGDLNNPQVGGRYSRLL